MPSSVVFAVLFILYFSVLSSYFYVPHKLLVAALTVYFDKIGDKAPNLKGLHCKDVQLSSLLFKPRPAQRRTSHGTN